MISGIPKNIHIRNQTGREEKMAKNKVKNVAYIIAPFFKFRIEKEIRKAKDVRIVA